MCWLTLTLAFLLRQGRRYPGHEGWTLPYRRWLTDLSFPSAAQHIALQEYRDAIAETEQRKRASHVRKMVYMLERRDIKEYRLYSSRIGSWGSSWRGTRW